jgi:hypothetical protein
MRALKKISAFIALLGSAIFCNIEGANAAVVSVLPLPNGGRPLIMLEGDIEPGDEDKFLDIARKSPSAVVQLKSNGGSVQAAIEIGRIIYYNDFSTFVKEADCASACALIWLAGNPRAVSTAGRVGFHAAYNAISKTQTRISSAGNALIGSYLSLLKINDNAIRYITETAPSSMRWLSQKDAFDVNLPALFLENINTSIDQYNKAVNKITEIGKADNEAVELYKSSAQMGFAGAQNNLGDLFESGDGVERNEMAAVHWYTRSAERGEPTAYFSLASILGKSSDERVLVDALKFAMLAYNQLPDGYNKNEAFSLIKDISSKVSSNSRVVALDLSRKWRPLYQEENLISDDPTPIK